MPAGVKSVSWDQAAQELRITYSSNRPDAILTPADIPQNVLNQGPQAVQDWINANGAKFLWGPSAPPPYIRARVTALNPLIGSFLISDSPITGTDDTAFPPPPPVPT
jgi:hypothetical protein